LGRVINAESYAADKKAKAAASSGSGASKSGGASGGGRKDGRAHEGSRKRRRDDDDGVKKPELKLEIPDILKVILVDDWEAITKNNQLVSLPREPTVQQLLEEFKAYALALANPPPQAIAIMPTLIAGLRTYFDRSLGSTLLYRFERAQYAEMRKKYITGQHVAPGTEREMSAIYGAEHLCRLLVKLPEMVSHTTMDDISVAVLREYVTELMRWLVREKDRVFLQAYDFPSTHYQNIART